MKSRLPTIGLPLLAKELVEQSARRRTYVLRVAYAGLLFLIAYLAFYDILSRSKADLFAVLGRGRELFDWVVGLQFAGIYLFLPALASGVLTAEKERNSLELLFLTKLGPWTIVLEKLLSRLTPMLGFLLLSLPLLAFAYTLGGITQTYLWSGVWTLAITVLQIGTLAVMCSAFFRTTAGSFIATYLLGFLTLFALPFLEEFGLLDLSYRRPPSVISVLLLPELLESVGMIGERPEDARFMFFAPYVFFEYANRNLPFQQLSLRSIPILFSSVGFLALARVFVVRRAFVPPRNYVLTVFRGLDRFFERLNENRLTKGILLVRGSTSLPADEPIAWRETTKRSLGTARYLFRMFAAMEIPVVALCILTVAVATRVHDLEILSVMLFILWILAVLIVSVKATSLVAGERTHRTLDVLLATPLASREIVAQKFRGLWRLMLVLSVPLVTIVLFEATFKGQYSTYAMSGYRHYTEFSVSRYLFGSALSVAVYLPLAAWLSFFVGMLIRSQGRAIIASLGIIVTWCVLPVFVLVMIDDIWLRGPEPDGFALLLLLSPATIVPINEFGAYHELRSSPWLAVVLNFALHGLCLFALREAALRRAARLLGRARE